MKLANHASREYPCTTLNQNEDACSDLISNFTKYGSSDQEIVNAKASYLWIKQSVCVLDIILIAIQTIVGSWWKMHVHVRHARLDKYSQEAAPNDNGPHQSCASIKKQTIAVLINE